MKEAQSLSVPPEPHVRRVTTTGAFAQTLFAKVFLLIANLATGIIVARSLAPAGRGEQAAMAMWPGLLSSLFLIGLPLSLTYSFRRYPDRQRELLSTGLVLGICFGCIAAAAGYVLVPHWLTKYNADVVAFARLMLLLIPFTTATFVLQAALEARSDFTTSNLSKSLPQVASVVLLAILAITHRLTPYSSTLCYLLPWTVVPPVLAWRLRNLIGPAIRGFRVSAKQLVSYGLRSYAIDILGTLSGQVDQVLVVGLLSAAGLGLYTVSLSVSRVLSVFHASLVTVIFPKAASLEPAEVVVLTGRAARLSTLLTAGASGCLVLLLPFLLVHLYGGAFREVIPVARILCVEIVVTGATSILSQSFMATGKPTVIAGLQVIGLLLTIPFMLVLIPHFGLSGAAIALLLSSCSRLAVVLACYPIILKSRVPNLLVNRSDIAFLVSRLKRRR